MPTKVVSSPAGYFSDEVEPINKVRKTLSCYGRQFFELSDTSILLPRQSNLVNALNLEPLKIARRKITENIYDKVILKKSILFESSRRIKSLEEMLFGVDGIDSDSGLLSIISRSVENIRNKNKEKLSLRRFENESNNQHSRDCVNLNFLPTFIQKGPTCKLAALGNINDYYFLNGLSDQWVPVYKKINPRFTSFPNELSVEKLLLIEYRVDINFTIIKKCYSCDAFRSLSISDISEALTREIRYLQEVKAFLLRSRLNIWYETNNPEESLSSIRQRAKPLGSSQGEVVSPEMLSDIGNSMGLNSEIIKCDDMEMLRKVAIENINRNYPVMTFIQGFPHMDTDRTDAQWQEHAIVLIGYRYGGDEFIYTDYGTQKAVTIKKLWYLMSIVPAQRRKEFYVKVEPGTRDVSFASDINRRQIELSGRWHDCQQVMDQSGYYPRVKKVVYFEYDKAGKMILDRDALDKIDLSNIKGLRKSALPSAKDSNFVTTLMVFTPKGNT